MGTHIIPYQWLMIFYIANQVLSALVQAMPPPNGNQFYNFWYKFLSLLISDFKSFSAAMPAPQVKTVSSTTGELTTVSIPVQQTLPTKGLL